MEDIFAPIDEEITSFERYFSENNRCILSAPFGEGKSYFLNEFIKSQVDEYDFITIYPTNYQICDNRDILEYIKRDVLFGLIALDETIIDGFDATKLGILRKAILESKDSVAECIPDILTKIAFKASYFLIKRCKDIFHSIFFTNITTTRAKIKHRLSQIQGNQSIP